MRKRIVIWLFFIAFFPSVYPSSIGEITKDGINARVDSTVGSFSLGYLNKGEKVEVIDKKYNWCKIILPERFISYVSVQYVKETSQNKGKVTASTVNLRKAPSLQAPVIGRLKKADTLYIVSKTDGWYKVKGYPYAQGWVHGNFVKTGQEDLGAGERKPQQMSVKLSETMPLLADPDMKKKIPLHQQIVQMGVDVVPQLEPYLKNADENTLYSMIGIFTQLGAGYHQLIPQFLSKVDAASPVISGVYLDVVQDILKPENSRQPYFYLARKKQLTAEAIAKAKVFLFDLYNMQVEKLVVPEEAGIRKK